MDGTTGDGQFDSVTVNGSAAKNAITLTQVGGRRQLPASRRKSRSTTRTPPTRSWSTAPGGNDSIDAPTLPAGAIQLTLDGGAGNDMIDRRLGNDSCSAGRQRHAARAEAA